MKLPDDEQMRRSVERFILRSGMALADLAEAIGYSRTAVGQYLSGRYDAHHATDENTLAIRRR